MPVLNIPGLDDPLVWDACPSFEGGMFSNSRANLLKPNQASYMENMDLDLSGRLTTRRGTKQIGDGLGERIQGIAYYLTPTTEELLLAAGGILRVFNGTNWALAGGFYQFVSALSPVTFVQGINVLYIAQVDSPLRNYKNGVLTEYGVNSVSEVTRIANGGGFAPSHSPAFLNNKHFLIYDEVGSVCVWFNTDGGGTDPGVGLRSIEVVLLGTDSDAQVAAALAVALDLDSKFDSENEFGVTSITVTCVAPGARTDATPGDSQLLITVVTQGGDEINQPPLGMSLLVWHTDRLIGSGVSTDPDTIYLSQFLDGSVWDRTNWSLRVGSGDGEPITAIVPWTNYNLIVLKQHSTWLVGCNPVQAVSDFQINRIHDRIGSMSPLTACQVGTDIFFLDNNHEVRSIKNIIASEQQKEVGPALSWPVADILDRINPAALSNACAIHWRNRYILAVPLDGATEPNYVLVFNTLTETWSGVWSNWQPIYFSERMDGGTRKLWFGQADGTVCDWMDYIPLSRETDLAFLDQGRAISSQVITRALTWNEPACAKTSFNVEMEFSN